MFFGPPRNEDTCKTPSTPATMSSQHCRMLQSRTLLRHCCRCGRDLKATRRPAELVCISNSWVASRSPPASVEWFARSPANWLRQSTVQHTHTHTHTLHGEVTWIQCYLPSLPSFLSTRRKVLPDCLHELFPGPFLPSYSVFVFHFPYFYSFLGRALD